MRESSYPKRDFTFGQMMLTLRTRIGLTQAGLAEILGVSRKAVGEWESGSSYPQAKHLQQFIELAIQHHAFSVGREVEEVHDFWQGARQKILLDDIWLEKLLILQSSPSSQELSGANTMSRAPRVDWDGTPEVCNFYGREWETDLLTGWVITERCRVVFVHGLGGTGKSALVISLMHRLAQHFEVVIWRSLHGLTDFEGILDDLIDVLDLQRSRGEPTSLERRQDILLKQMRKTRILIVLDNVESALKEGEWAGKMRPGFESFEDFLRLAAETRHQSCVLICGREKPAVLVPIEGYHDPVRSFRLARMDPDSCEKIMAEKDLKGSTADRARLIEAYSGNPLALKIVAQTILDLFEGEIALFLEQQEVIFGGVRDLLEDQFIRLSCLEQKVLLWLATLRKPATLDELMDMSVPSISRTQLLEALDSLYRRSLIEQGQTPGSFALQALVQAYLTGLLITRKSLD